MAEAAKHSRSSVGFRRNSFYPSRGGGAARGARAQIDDALLHGRGYEPPLASESRDRHCSPAHIVCASCCGGRKRLDIFQSPASSGLEQNATRPRKCSPHRAGPGRRTGSSPVALRGPYVLRRDRDDAAGRVRRSEILQQREATLWEIYPDRWRGFRLISRAAVCPNPGAAQAEIGGLGNKDAKVPMAPRDEVPNELAA